MKTSMNLSFNRIAMAVLGSALMFTAACKKDLAPTQQTNNASSKLSTKAVGVSGTKTVCYVEVNSNDMREVGKYTLSTGEPLFDIGVIFAANINYNTTTHKAELFFNTQVTNVLTNKATYIQPLQAKGIKVTLSILGNHQGAGFCNFTSKAAATDFATQLSNAVTTYGLDGIDFDDEYADYGTNSTPQPNDSSFVYLVTALRQLMPTKLITFYYIGPAASHQSYGGVTVGSKVDYSWNPYYSTYSAPNVPGLTNSKLSAAAVDIQSTSASTAASYASQTVTDGYGVYLFYNLTSTDVHSYLTGVSNNLYGKATVYGTGGTTTGVTFYQDINYAGTATNSIAKGNYTLSQLQALGFVNDWASSVKIPSGWTVTMYSNDNFAGTSWSLTSNTTNFTTLSPNANDVVSSVKIQ